jgi:hypothetical protein
MADTASRLSAAQEAAVALQHELDDCKAALADEGRCLRSMQDDKAGVDRQLAKCKAAHDATAAELAGAGESIQELEQELRKLLAEQQAEMAAVQARPRLPLPCPPPFWVVVEQRCTPLARDVAMGTSHQLAVHADGSTARLIGAGGGQAGGGGCRASQAGGEQGEGGGGEREREAGRGGGA